MVRAAPTTSRALLDREVADLLGVDQRTLRRYVAAHPSSVDRPWVTLHSRPGLGTVGLEPGPAPRSTVCSGTARWADRRGGRHRTASDEIGHPRTQAVDIRWTRPISPSGLPRGPPNPRLLAALEGPCPTS